jgi:hypothetical protein
MPRLQSQGLNYATLPLEDRLAIQQVLRPLGVEVQQQALCNLRFALPNDSIVRLDSQAVIRALMQAGFSIINRKILGDGSVTGALTRIGPISSAIGGARHHRADYGQFDVVS